MARRGAASVARSHSTAVSRWLVMPTQLTAGVPAPPLQSLAAGSQRRLPDTLRQVLNPARLREILAEFLVSAARDGAVVGHDQSGHARCAGVDRENTHED